MGALGPDPEELGSPKRRFKGSKVVRYGNDAVIEPCELGHYVDFSSERPLEQDQEIHVVEKLVECGEPQYSCRDLHSMEQRYEDIPKHHCPYCLNIPDFPWPHEGTGIRRFPFTQITGNFDRNQALHSIEQYLDGVLHLTKISISCLFDGDADWDDYVTPTQANELAGLFLSGCCREDDSHYGREWWNCKCLSKDQNFPETCNLGRMLRLSEVNEISTRYISILQESRLMTDDGSEPSREMKKWCESINDRWRRMCLTAEERAAYWFHPQEDTRFAECVAQLEHEVTRVLNDGPGVIDHDPYNEVVGAERVRDWDNGKYTLFVRGMGNVIVPALAWICYDSGLSDDQVVLLARVLFTLLDHHRSGPRPPIPGFAEGEPPTLSENFDDVWSIMYIVCDISLRAPHQFRIHERLAARTQKVHEDISQYRQRRSTVVADCTLRLDYAWEFLKERSLTIQDVLKLSESENQSGNVSNIEGQSSGSPTPPPAPSCSICAEDYSDADKLHRPMRMCEEPKHHICSRCCLRIVFEAEVLSPDVRCVMCRKQCNEWTMLSDRTDRVLDDDETMAEGLIELINNGPEY